MAETKAERRAAWKRRTGETARALREAKAVVTLKKKRTIPLAAQSPAEIRVAAWRKANPQRTIVDVSGKHTRVHAGIQSLTRPEQQQYMTLFTDYARGKQLAQQRAQQLYNISQKMKATERRRVEQKRLEQQRKPDQKVLRIALPAEETLVSKFFKPKDISPEALKKKQRKVQEWQKKDFPKWVTDFVGDPLKLSDKERKMVLPFYGKTSADAQKQKKAVTSFMNYVGKEIKTNPEKIVLFAALPPGLRLAGAGVKAAGITKLITKIPHGQLVAKRTVQIVSAGLGVVYSHDVYKRVTEPVLTGYKDGKSTTTEKTLPNGDIAITVSTEQIPQYRKSTGPEQIERMGGIFATELAPLSISHRIINRGVKKGFKPEPKPKPMVKVTTKIKRAGRIIKTKTKEFAVTQKAELKKFIAAVEAEAVLVKPKAKVKAKPKVKPKVKTVNIMKDPVAMRQLNKMKTSMSSINRIASPKSAYKVQQAQKMRATSKQQQVAITQKQALLNRNITIQSKEIQKLMGKIKSMRVEGKNVNPLMLKLHKLLEKTTHKQQLEMDALLQKYDVYIMAKADALKFMAKFELSKIKPLSRTVTTTKQKIVLISRTKIILKQQQKLKAVLLLYSKQAQKPVQKQKITTIVKSISKQISDIKATQKIIEKVKVIPAVKVPTKKIPPTKRVPVRKVPPRRPPKKPPVVPPIIVPVIPAIPTPRKVKVIKKKKKASIAYEDWFIKNSIPTLKSLYG